MFLEFNSAKESDAALVFEWRNDPETCAQSFSASKLKWKDHLQWFKDSLSNPQRQIFIVSAAIDSTYMPVAVIRRDLKIEDNSHRYTLSWMVNPQARGKGIGNALLSQFVGKFPATYLAEIKNNNLASIKMAKNAGFQIEKTVSDYQVWILKK